MREDIFQNIIVSNRPLNQSHSTKREPKKTVCQTDQASLLPHHCHGHWLQLSINNSVPLCWPLCIP